MQEGMKFSRLVAWLPLGFAITVMSFVIYGAVQQVYRQGAKDPQLQMAEDIARKFVTGPIAESEYLPPQQVDVTKSLSPFVIVFDGGNNVYASNAVLNGQTPRPPVGAIQYARDHGQNRVTWQTPSGQRFATVLQKSSYGSGQEVIVVGRSLREVEVRESQLTMMVALGWMIAMVGSLVLSLFFGRP